MSHSHRDRGPFAPDLCKWTWYSGLIDSTLKENRTFIIRRRCQKRFSHCTLLLAQAPNVKMPRHPHQNWFVAGFLQVHYWFEFLRHAFHFFSTLLDLHEGNLHSSSSVRIGSIVNNNILTCLWTFTGKMYEWWIPFRSFLVMIESMSEPAHSFARSRFPPLLSRSTDEIYGASQFDQMTRA